MRYLIILVSFFHFCSHASVVLRVDKKMDLSLANYDYSFAGQLNQTRTYILKKEGIQETALVTVSMINPLTVTKLKKLAKTNVGSEELQIVKVNNKLFFEFYNKSNHFYYHPDGLYIQIRASKTLGLVQLKEVL